MRQEQISVVAARAMLDQADAEYADLIEKNTVAINGLEALASSMASGTEPSQTALEFLGLLDYSPEEFRSLLSEPVEVRRMGSLYFTGLASELRFRMKQTSAFWNEAHQIVAEREREAR